VAKKKIGNGGTTEAEGKSLEAVKVDFETALKAVEKVVHSLESGDLTLDESLVAYEQGVQKLRQCYEHLGKVERRIELLVGFDRDGKPVTRPFDDGAESIGNSLADLEAKQAGRGRRRGAVHDDGDDLKDDGFEDSDATGLF
jgi:exodeoxyribonuclease VII small subunit